MSYIYVITNSINGKQYVGKTNWNIEKRFKEHLKDSKREQYEKRPLYNAINKYGVEHFSVEQLEECSYKEAEDKEKYWINKLNTYKNGYNATLGGDGKVLYDYEWIAYDYLKIQNQKEVANKYGCCIDTVRKACKLFNIEIIPSGTVTKEKYGKKVQMLDKNTLKVLNTFQSLGDAGRFLTSEDIERTKLSTITAHISEVCRNKRKSAYGYKWKFL